MVDAADTATVSKAELDSLRAIKALMDKAWDNKETGANFRKLLKTVEPTIKIPDDLADSAIAPIKGEVDETKKLVTDFGARLDKFLAETNDEKATTALKSDLSAAQKRFGLDDDGMKKVMERMRDKNNPDVEAAAAFVASQIPPPKPVDTGMGGLGAGLFGSTAKDDNYEALQTGGDPFKPGGWFDKEAAKILNEPTEQAA
jgi:hypothetical protein